MIYTFTDIFDNLEHAALKLLSPDDDVTNYMKVAYNFVTDGRYAQCNSSKVSTWFFAFSPLFSLPLRAFH